MGEQLSFIVAATQLKEELFQLFGEDQDQILFHSKYLPILEKYEEGKDYIYTKGWRAQC